MRSLALLFLAFGIAGSSAPTEPIRSSMYCSPVPMSQFYTGSPLFIGTATGDSVTTGGPRPAQTRKLPEGLKEPAFVQVFRVERLSTRMDSSLLRSLKESGNRAVIVPWSHGSDCHSLSWAGSALWAKPSRRGVFSATLRPRTDWIGGIPTFDTGATYDDTPYPGTGYTDSSRNLNAGEFLSVLDSLPPVFGGRPDKVGRYLQLKKRYDAIFLWAAAHPDQALRRPLSEWVEGGKDWMVRAPLDTIISPFAGTYRFVLKVPQSDTVVFYGRSELRPSSIIWKEAAHKPTRAATDPFGYYLNFGIAKTVDGLPNKWPAPNSGGYMGGGFKPVFTSRDSTVWQGELDVFLALQSLVSDSLLRSKLAHVRKVDLNNMMAGDRTFLPARILRRKNEALEISIGVKEGDSTIATVRGRRISKAIFDINR